MCSTSITSRSSTACACASARSASTTRSSGREAWGLGGGSDGGVQCARGRGGADTRLYAQPSGCTALGLEVSATLDAGMSHYTGAQMLGQYVLANYEP